MLFLPVGGTRGVEATGEEAKIFSQGQNFTNYGVRIRSLMLDGVCTLSSWIRHGVGECDGAKFGGFSVCLPRTRGV